MNPIFRGFCWLKHYLISDTLHGTHSPFVYHFLENVVYKNSARQKEYQIKKNTAKDYHKYHSLLFRLLNFSNKKEILSLSPSNTSKQIIENSILITYSSEKLYFEQVEKINLLCFGENLHAADLMDSYHRLKHKTDEQSIFIILNIRGDVTRLKVWNHLCKDPSNVISIDLFDVGVLFFEQKKPKEHFKIFYKE